MPLKKLTIFLCIFYSLSGFAQEKRIAYVIGNGDYTKLSKLKNPVNDAILMGNTLKDLGFEVRIDTNLTYRRMNQSLREYMDTLRQFDVALLYFAGHGAQVLGQKYIYPVDAYGSSDALSEEGRFSVDRYVERMSMRRNNLSIVILDACLENVESKLVTPGDSISDTLDYIIKRYDVFAPKLPPSGTIISLSTSPGGIALDGSGDNGLFTEVLTEQMKIPQRITDVFMNTRNKVSYRSGERQIPTEINQLKAPFWFIESE